MSAMFDPCERKGPHLAQKREQLISSPARRIPSVEIGPLGSCVHASIDGRPAAEKPPSAYHGDAVAEMHRFACRVVMVSVPLRVSDMREPEQGVNDISSIVVVGSGFDDQDGELGVSLRQPSSNDASRCASWSTKMGQSLSSYARESMH